MKRDCIRAKKKKKKRLNKSPWAELRRVYAGYAETTGTGP